MGVVLPIIIADDHPIFRKGLAEVILSDSSLALVGEAHDGEEALRLIDQARPAIAILDINMPRQSGLQVARQLKKKGWPTKAVLLTMHDEIAMFDEAMEIGVHAYVLKESAVEDLLTAVRAVDSGRGFVSPAIAGLLMKRREGVEALRREKPGLDMLTPTERRILMLIAEDKTTKEIAQRLTISPRTVETHRQNMSYKLHLSGSHSLLKFAFDNKGKLLAT